MADFSDLIVMTLGDIEDALGSSKFPAFIAESEAFFENQVKAIADHVLAHPSIRAVFVSGPTSSGKTTSSRLLSERLTASGRRTIPVELDDYYLPQQLRFDDEGRPDFESIDTIDLPLLGDQLERLFNDEEVGIPTFRFTDRTRHFEPNKKIRMDDHTVLVIEGLHGLDEGVMAHVPPEGRTSFFIMPHGRLLSDARLLSGSDIRKLRRISRDVNHRGATALDTIDYWPMIERAERDFIPRYLAAAEFYVNSMLPYEFAVIPPLARMQIEDSLSHFFEGTLPASSYSINERGHSNLELAVKDATRLSRICEQLPAVSPLVVPEHSILREFI